MTSNNIFKKGQPKWLNLQSLATKNEEENSVFKRGMPDWLRFTEPEPNDKEDSVFKDGMPDWLDFKINGNINSGQPDWLETTPDGKIIDKSFKHDNWNLTYLSPKQQIYCESRGIYKFLKGHNKQIVKTILDQWKYQERITGKIITLNDIKTSNIPHIREKAELEEINELKNYIAKHNSIIEPDIELEFDKFPTPEDFNFNIDAESQHYLLTHNVYDVETSKQSQSPVALGAYCYEANRLVIAINSKLMPEREGEFHITRRKNSTSERYDEIIQIYTPNLWEGVLIANIELLLSTVFESALMEGHNDLLKVFLDLKLPKRLKIDENLLEGYINGFPKKRSLWLAHNARFDIDMINHTHKKANYKFTYLQKKLEHETLKYFLGNEIPKEKIRKDPEIAKRTYNFPAYKIHLGNTDAGFKFRINMDNAGNKTIFRANMSPKQKKTFTQLWMCDTFQLSLALQNPAHSLKDLSAHHPKFKKMDYKDLNFPVEHMDIQTTKKITKPMKYLMYDLFATLTVYEKETQELNYEELQTLMKEHSPKFELKTAWRPRVSNIISSASISKQVIFPFLEAETGLNRKAIENNIAHERLHQTNFQEVYSGGVTEAITYGIIESDFTTGDRVFYDDYESLYPNVARLTFTEKLYILAANRTLHTYLTTNLKSAEKDFWEVAEKTIKIIKRALKGNEKAELPEDIFKDLIGTVQIYTDQPIQIRTRNEKDRRCWRKVRGLVTLHLIDLLNAIVRGTIEFNANYESLKGAIEFKNVERYDFKKMEVPEFGKEIFTLLLGLRRIKKSENNPIEKMLKYIVNTAYGITAEGINNEDITGKLFIPVIFSTITAGARFLISIPEMLIPKLGGTIAYLDTDSIIYKIQEKLRSRVLQLSRKLSILKEETDYGKIHKAFIAKKKKYYLLSENIAEHKFKNQFIKLPNGKYIVGKIHGIASFKKELYTKAVFPMINELFNTFSIEKPTITKSIRKYIHLHPRFSNLSYRKQTHSKIKGLLHFFQKTRKITVINNVTKEKTKVRVPNPVFTLFRTKYDSFDIYFYYDLSNNKILITNLKDKPIRSNFGIYTNLGNKKIKIFYTIPIEEDSQLEWENKFLKMVIDTLWNNFEQFWKRIAQKQREFILTFAKSSKALLKDEYLAEIPIKDENFNSIFDNWFSEFRCPIPKNKRFFDLDFKLYEYKDTKFDKKTKNWYYFCQEYGDILLSEFESSSNTDLKSMIEETIKSNDTMNIRLLNQLLSTLGLNRIQLPTIRWLRAKASDMEIPNRSKMKKDELWNYLKSRWFNENKPSEAFEYLIERIIEMIDYSPDGKIEWIIDQLMGTNTVGYSNFLSFQTERESNKLGLTKRELKTMSPSFLEALGVENIEEFQEEEIKKDEYTLEDVDEETRQNIVGFQFFEKFMNITLEKFVKEAINKDDLESKLKQQLSFKEEDFNRYIIKKYDRYLTTAVHTIKEKNTAKEMLTHEVLDQTFHTDGIDWRLTAYLPELDYAGELVANQNTFYSQNLINLGRIGSYIYYTTHNKADQIDKVWSTNVSELPCPKSAKYIQIPLKMRYLPDSQQDVFSESQIKLAFNSDELNELVQDQILEPTNDKQESFNNKDKQLFNAYIHKKIISKSYMIIGRKKPEGYQEQFPIYVERKFLDDCYSFEICTNRGWEYNSKLYIEFLVQPNKTEQTRFLNVDLHINPNSHNLLNIELFKASIKDIEANDFIVKELLLGLFTIKELSFFSRNASLTISDMKKKEELSYLRKTQYLFVTHTLLQEAIENESQCKIGKLALTGQLKLEHTTPQVLFAYLNNTIIQKHDKWLKTLDPSKSLSVASKQISTLPHRSSFGITTNHWKRGIHISLYTKDEHWYKSKITRVARARNFEITPSLSKKIMNKVWDEKSTVRYEITLMGFEAIHTKELHAVLKELQQFFFQLDAYFEANTEATEIFLKHAKKIGEMIPNALFQTTYTTPIETLTSGTGEWIQTYTDEVGYSHKLKTYDEIHKEINKAIHEEKKPPDPS